MTFAIDHASARMGQHVTLGLEHASVPQTSQESTVVLSLVSAIPRSV